MQINIVNVQETQKTNKAGKPYQELEVIYKDDTGKANTKKLMSFNYPDTYKVLSKGKSGDTLNIVTEKVGEYWQWTAIGQTVVPSTTQSSGGVPTTGTYQKTSSSYETPEERAKKQVYIIRQSSLSSAISALAVGSKSPHSSEEIISLAKEFEAFVLGKDLDSLMDAVTDMEDDIPY